MSTTKQTRPVIAPNYTGPRLFGAPVGDFSVLQTLLITVASGFAAFFAFTFLSIVTMLVLMLAGYKHLDFAIAYRWVGLPVGILVLVLAGGYLGSLLVARMRRR